MSRPGPENADGPGAKIDVMEDVPNPLEQLSLTQLRERTSLKWRAYPEDVLPLWVAEMDVLLAEPVARAIDRRRQRGDTGYPAGTAYAEALAAFAAAALGLGRASPSSGPCSWPT